MRCGKLKGRNNYINQLHMIQKWYCAYFNCNYFRLLRLPRRYGQMAVLRLLRLGPRGTCIL